MGLVTFGEAMLRLSPQQHRRIQDARAFDAYVAGSELNVAVAAARLGIPAQWVSRLTDNALGRMIESGARQHGVDAHLEWTSGDRVGLYFLEPGSAPRQSTVLYDRAGSAFSRIGPGMIDWMSVLRDARWFHVSGITPALSESAAATTAEALQAARQTNVPISYDVNYRSRLWTPDRARAVQVPLMKFVDVLVTTEEDARTVFGVAEASGTETARALAKRLDVGVVAMTIRESEDGCGAIVVAGDAVYTAPRHEVEVVDRAGAGDAFTAGLIASRLSDWGGDWDRAVLFATAVAAIKLGTPGDFCLASRDDVDRMMRRPHSGASR